MLRHLGKKPIHLLVINSAWGRRARNVRLSRCQDGARENQRCSVTVRHWLWLVLVCTGTFLQVIGAAGRTTARGGPDRAYENSVLPRQHLAEFLDQIPGPSDDSRERPHP